jgi:hypothetical protein
MTAAPLGHGERLQQRGNTLRAAKKGKDLKAMPKKKPGKGC